MTDADLIALVLGILLPLAIAVIQQRAWPDWARALVAFGIYFLATALTMWFVGTFGDPTSVREWVRTFLTIFATAYGSFKLAWQPSGLTARIERATTPTP